MILWPVIHPGMKKKPVFSLSGLRECVYIRAVMNRRERNVFGWLMYDWANILNMACKALIT